MFLNHLSRITHTLLSGPDRILPLASPWARPLRIHIAVNDYCNLRCPHCLREDPSIQKDRNRLGVEDIRPLAPWFRSAMFVALAGLGEPFIQKDLFEIIDLVQSQGATPSVITNGVLLDEKTIDRLVGVRPLLLNLSIDAGTPEIFEKVRLGAKFDEVAENLDRLAAAKRAKAVPFPVMSVNMTLMRDTIGDVRAVVDLARRWDIHHIVAQTIYFGPGQKDHSQKISNREAQEALAEAEPYARENGVEIRYVPVAGDFETLKKDEKEGDRFSPSYPYHNTSKAVPGSKGYYCSNLWHQMYIDVYGNMTYCCMADFGTLGNIREMKPARLWNHPKMVALRKRLIDGDPPPECRKCFALEEFGRRKMYQTWKAEFGPLRQMF